MKKKRLTRGRDNRPAEKIVNDGVVLIRDYERTIRGLPFWSRLKYCFFVIKGQNAKEREYLRRMSLAAAGIRVLDKKTDNKIAGRFRMLSRAVRSFRKERSHGITEC